MFSKMSIFATKRLAALRAKQAWRGRCNAAGARYIAQARQRRERELKRQLETELFVLTLATALGEENEEQPSRKERSADRKRQRMDWNIRIDSLSDKEFIRTYRVNKQLFNEILLKILPAIKSKESMARSHLNGPVAAELKLSMTLRWLAGGSYLDIYQMHGVSYSQFPHLPLANHFRP